MSNKTRIILVTTLAAASASAVAFAATDSGTRDPSPPTVEQVDQRLAEHFQVFRNPELATALPEPGAKRFGSNAQLARKALTTARGNDVFVVPANDTVCVIGEDVGGSCQRIADAVNEPFVTVGVCAPSIPRGTAIVSALVPDRIKRVTVEQADGTRTPIDATNNVAIATIDNRKAAPTAVSWTNTNGKSGTITLSGIQTAQQANCQ